MNQKAASPNPRQQDKLNTELHFTEQSFVFQFHPLHFTGWWFCNPAADQIKNLLTSPPEKAEQLSRQFLLTGIFHEVCYYTSQHTASNNLHKHWLEPLQAIVKD